MIPKLEELIKQYGQVRFLCLMDDSFAGMELGAMVNDAKFFFKHKNELEKIAVVGAARWIEVMTKLFANLMEGA